MWSASCVCLSPWEPSGDNDTLRRGECVVESSRIEMQICSDDESSWSCYTSWVFFTVSDGKNKTVDSHREIQYGPARIRDRQYLVNWQKENVSKGKTLTCFYQVDTSNSYTGHVQFAYSPEKALFVASMVFFALTLGILSVWGAVEVWRRVR